MFIIVALLYSPMFVQTQVFPYHTECRSGLMRGAGCRSASHERRQIGNCCIIRRREFEHSAFNEHAVRPSMVGARYCAATCAGSACTAGDVTAAEALETDHDHVHRPAAGSDLYDDDHAPFHSDGRPHSNSQSKERAIRLYSHRHLRLCLFHDVLTSLADRARTGCRRMVSQQSVAVL